uniref:Crossover junction endonuclease MUS81 n=1 Tax=Macrostomum lignano TaxID=282301 RepID=A0A1I8IYN0_9PLAT
MSASTQTAKHCQKRVRKKRMPIVQNQFFLHHIREMRDLAVAKKWQSKHTYAKMVRALERYPLRLETPRACLILEGFGQKTCETLQTKLNEFAKELGVSEDEALRIGNERFATPKSLKLKVQKPAKRRRISDQTQPDGDQSAVSDGAATASVGTGSLCSGADVGQSTEGSASGELAPAAGSHYTAWSAMSGLVKRGLVDRRPAAGRNPGTYTLTPAGQSAAASLMSAATADKADKQPTAPAAAAAGSKAAAGVPKNAKKSIKATTTSKDAESAASATSKPIKQSVHAISDSDEEKAPVNYSVHSVSDSDEAEPPVAPLPSPPRQELLQLQPKLSLIFDYCSEPDYSIVSSKSLAWRKFDSIIDADCALVLCEYEQLVRSNLHYSLDLAAIGRFTDGQVAAFVRERDLPELSTKAAAEAAEAAKAAAEKAAASSRSIENKPLPPPLPLRTVSSNPNPPASAAMSNSASLLLSKPLITNKSLSWQRHASATATGTSESAAASSAESEPGAKLLYSIQPGGFDVIFCIDNREHFGMGSVKQMLLPGLLRNNVKCDVRPLQVSDFLWVAKCRSTGREAVLNLLVERKRLDDLASSIKDGRFKEQKFRLRRSGIAQLLLLVEGFGGRSGGHVRMPEETLAQAVCNSQLIDGCAVKYTDSAQHTVSYLTLLTCHLRDLYSGRQLLVYDSMPATGGVSKDSRPTVSAVLPLGGPGTDANAVDFAEFNRAAIKSKKLVVREMLAKHLLQIGGVTMEKALAIVQQYPTVQALLDAYAACETDAERRRLLSGICHDRIFDKRIGDSISKSVMLSFK